MEHKSSDSHFELGKRLAEHLMEDRIHHPSHYQGKHLEVINVIEDFDLDFCLGNSIKYILRAGKKDNELEDLKKAVWYLNRKINQIEKEIK